MMRDVLTVMWRERKDLFRQKGSRMRSAFMLATPVVMLGVYMPWQVGDGWLGGYWSLIASVIIPMLLVGTVIPESFAGERERHTLGTLLASRLPDRAILLGKVATAMAYAWSVTLLVHLLSMVTVNIVSWDGSVVFFTPTIVLVNVGTGLLMACFMAGLGVLISLRSATVQSASMFLMGAVFAPLLLLQIAALVVMQLASGGRASISELVGAVDWGQVMIIAGGVLTAASVGLLWAATARFRRARLMLD
jgi:ABC-2 type transport system permease protein